MKTEPTLRLRTRPTFRGVFVWLVALALTALGVLTSMRAPLAAGLVLVCAGIFSVAQAVWLRRALRRARLTVTRTSSPPEPAWGTPTTVTVRLGGSGLPRAVVWWLDSRVVDNVCPQVASYEGTVSLNFTRTGWQAQYQVTPAARGEWPLGPMRVRFADPMKFFSLRADLLGTTPLRVRPRIANLASDSAAGPSQDTGRVIERTHGSHRPDTDDSLLREYSPGDDVRRVHWPTSARRRVLMVRAEESAPVRPITLILDGRLVRPSWTSQRDPRATTIAHWPVDLIASVAAALVDAGSRVSLRVCTVGDYRQPIAATEIADTLLRLPDLSAASDVASLVNTVAEVGDQVTLVVMAPVDGAAARRLAAVAQDGSTLRAVIAVDGGSATQSAAEASATVMAQGGWQVHVLRMPDTAVAAAGRWLVRS